MTNAERRRKRRHSHRPIYILLTIIIILGFAIIGNQSDDAIRDRDVLDKLNLIDQSIDTTVKNRSQVNLEPYSTMSSVPLTQEERDIVERVTAAEARGEDMQTQMAVAQTILDRSELWGMTVTEVVTAEGQFAKPYQGEISDSVKLAVANVFDGGVRIFPEATTHFHDDSIPPPDWTENKVNRGSIGRLSFWY
jgi:spore germination cell wall hydrolase CwlJ-like protein